MSAELGFKKTDPQMLGVVAFASDVFLVKKSEGLWP
jgi:hypothetical protein